MPWIRKPTALYEIKITLMYLEPPIWRRVAVPKDITLGDLHTAIQMAMGCEDSHLHDFQIGNQRYGPMTLEPLGLGDEPANEDIVHLNAVARPKAKFRYCYDFGDDWLHEIRIEREVASATGKRNARCIAGERGCPPEDRGCVPGYSDMVAMLADPAHEEYGEMREWVGEDFDPMCFDLERVDRRLSALKL